MFEAIASALMMLMTVIISYLAFSLRTNGKRHGAMGALLELDWILEKTPAQASFFMFMLQSFIVVNAAAFAFRVSNHIILTLDILYFVSILMLILFHNLKEAANLLIQEN